jgi:hypothetical protein
MSDSKDQFTMQDPTRQYPQAPFDRQPQPAPGLAKKMNPAPDHVKQATTASEDWPVVARWLPAPVSSITRQPRRRLPPSLMRWRNR